MQVQLAPCSSLRLGQASPLCFPNWLARMRQVGSNRNKNTFDEFIPERHDPLCSVHLFTCKHFGHNGRIAGLFHLQQNLHCNIYNLGRHSISSGCTFSRSCISGICVSSNELRMWILYVSIWNTSCPENFRFIHITLGKENADQVLAASESPTETDGDDNTDSN